MNYKFLHKDGYEAIIRDTDAFIGYLNDEAINESTPIFDEVNQEGLQAYKVPEFKEIFDIMKTNGWTVYVLSKPIKTNVSMQNMGLVDISKVKQNTHQEHIQLMTNAGSCEVKETVEDKNVQTGLIAKANLDLGISNEIKLFLAIAAVLLICLSIVMIMIAVKNLSDGNLKFSEYFIWQRLVMSIGGVFVVVIILKKFFLKGNFVVLMCGAILLFAVSSIQFVSSIEYQRSKSKDIKSETVQNVDIRKNEVETNIKAPDGSILVNLCYICYNTSMFFENSMYVMQEYTTIQARK